MTLQLRKSSNTHSSSDEYEHIVCALRCWKQLYLTNILRRSGDTAVIRLVLYFKTRLGSGVGVHLRTWTQAVLLISPPKTNFLAIRIIMSPSVSHFKHRMPKQPGYNGSRLTPRRLRLPQRGRVLHGTPSPDRPVLSGPVSDDCWPTSLLGGTTTIWLTMDARSGGDATM